LRIIVRNTATLAATAQSKVPPVKEPLGGDLVAMVVVDTPQTTRSLFRDELAALGLDDKGAFHARRRRMSSSMSRSHRSPRMSGAPPATSCRGGRGTGTRRSVERAVKPRCRLKRTRPSTLGFGAMDNAVTPPRTKYFGNSHML
jgi:hypothetical protein